MNLTPEKTNAPAPLPHDLADLGLDVDTPRADAALTAALDRALAPPPAPDGLARRIVNHTTPNLLAQRRGPVLGWVGRPVGTLRTAAAIALLAAAGLAMWTLEPGMPTRPTPTIASTVAGAATPTSTAADDGYAIDTLAFSEDPVPGVGRNVDRLTALVIINQTSELVGRPPSSPQELAEWYYADPLTY